MIALPRHPGLRQGTRIAGWSPPGLPRSACGGPRRPGVVLAIEEFSEGTMYLVSLEDYPLGIWFFNESGHQDGIFVEKVE